MRLRCAISPDADDRFMFRGILAGRVDREGLEFEVVSRDTDALNHMAGGDGPDLTAISIAHYPRVAEHYQLLNHGGSVGRGYGPVLVSAAPTALAALAGRPIAVPGLTTTAWTVLRLALDFEAVVIPIDPPALTFDAVRAGRVDAALVIHEGRLTFPDEGFHLVLDLGAWWAERTGLPLPLGGNVIRRDLPAEVVARADRVVRASIADGLADREAAITWLLERSATLRTRERVDHYLSLYANADTLDYGADGRAGVRELLRQGADAGLLPPVGAVDFVGVAEPG